MKKIHITNTLRRHVSHLNKARVRDNILKLGSNAPSWYQMQISLQLLDKASEAYDSVANPCAEMLTSYRALGMEFDKDWRTVQKHLMLMQEKGLLKIVPKGKKMLITFVGLTDASKKAAFATEAAGTQAEVAGTKEEVAAVQAEAAGTKGEEVAGVQAEVAGTQAEAAGTRDEIEIIGRAVNATSHAALNATSHVAHGATNDGNEAFKAADATCHDASDAAADVASKAEAQTDSRFVTHIITSTYHDATTFQRMVKQANLPIHVELVKELVKEKEEKKKEGSPKPFSKKEKKERKKRKKRKCGHYVRNAPRALCTPHTPDECFAIF